MAAMYAAKEYGAQVLLFGHTHVPLVDNDGSLLTLNPGAAGDPLHPTCGVLTIENGEILLVGKARGSRQGNNLLVEKIHACGGIDFSLPLLLGYTGLTDVFLKKYVEDSRALWENGTDRLDSTLIGGVIGTHAGPGAFGLAFFDEALDIE